MDDWVEAVFAFLGAGVGSAFGFWATRGRTSVERDARRREEWGRRFTTAIDRATSTDPTSRQAGRALIEELLRSELATDDDRQEAQGVLDAIATGGQHNLRLLLPRADLDDVTVVRDTDGESDGPEGGDG